MSDPSLPFHALRFNRAAGSYEKYAQVQESMANTLSQFKGWPEFDGHFKGDGLRILEMGCGTGLLTRKLLARFPDAAMAATDIAPAMLEVARASMSASMTNGTQFFLIDASGQADSPDAIRKLAPFHLAASNALVQWFPDLTSHFRRVHSLLSETGQYWLSGFSDDNFPELNAILRDPPFAYSGFPGHGLDAVAEAARAAGFSVAYLESETLPVTYPSTEALLGAIRGLGASRRPEKKLTRSNLETLVLRYQERYSTQSGVYATWRPWFAALRKT